MLHQATVYKGIPAHILTDGDLSLLVTDYGAKLQSIRYHGREMLCQSFSISPEYRRSADGDIFETGEFSGFDHLFPNISAAPYPDGPWEGIPMPDHGEVWSRDWESFTEENVLTFRVSGSRLPYKFQVSLELRSNILNLRYTAQNLSGHPMKYLWCCHPLFVMENGMELILPGAGEIVNTAPGQKYLGGYLEKHPWPVSNDGRDLSRLSDSHRSCNKYYVWNDRPRNNAILRYPDGTEVTFDTEDTSIPYMGVWVDEFGYGKYAMGCIAPELASAALDLYEPADLYQKNSILSPGETRSWSMTIAFRTK